MPDSDLRALGSFPEENWAGPGPGGEHGRLCACSEQRRFKRLKVPLPSMHRKTSPASGRPPREGHRRVGLDG